MKNRGITLVALVVTIIILLILSAVTISTLTGENGILTKAVNARKEAKIREYEERINLIREEVRIENKGETPTLNNMKAALEKEQKKTNWIANLVEQVEGGEKLILTTKEGYIFHITGTKTEYKGEGGEVKDTEELGLGNIIIFTPTETTANGKMVQITDNTGKDYYEIEYQIGSTEGQWTKIKSGEEVEVKYGNTIYARLVYVTERGIIHNYDINHTETTVSVKNMDLSNVKRKTDIPFAEIFEVTWGSEGTGEIYYRVEGNLLFKETTYQTNNRETNLSELELGTYTIKLGIATPSQVENGESEWKDEWKVTATVGQLASTSVININNATVTANAIYSEYDLAHFRDLVNGGQTTINGKLMNDIDLSNICSATVGSWEPIGKVVGLWESWVDYEGTFDGAEKTINDLYIYSENAGLGLFGIGKNNCLIQNLTVSGSIECHSQVTSTAVAGIIATYWKDDNSGKTINFKNLHNRASVKGNNMRTVAGIIGNTGGTIIEDCSNKASISGYCEVGGIIGIEDSRYGGVEVRRCYNEGEIISTGGRKINNETFSQVGGIVGAFYLEDSKITKCYNNANGNGIVGAYGGVGGIAGCLYGEIEDCYNLSQVEGNGIYVGGICGGAWNGSNGVVQNLYNTGKIIGTGYSGGILGAANNKQNLNNFINVGIIDTSSGGTNIQEIVGAWLNNLVWGNGTWLESTDTSVADMKTWSDATIKSYLGDNFAKDTEGINNGLPVLAWQLD